MFERLKAYLQLGRAQTFPADWLLVMVPFLHAGFNLVHFVILSVMMFFIHWATFGDNSLMDYTQGYDKIDPSKKHHPLMDGRISVHNAMNALVWTKSIFMVFATIFTLWISPNPPLAFVSLFMCFVWLTAYNQGLSKESLGGFFTITAAYASFGAWGWFLSHSILTPVGLGYVVYASSVILFQITWSGHLKDIKVKEKGNLLVHLGADVEAREDGTEIFVPGTKVRILGYLMKIFGVVSLFYLTLSIGQVPFYVYIWSAVLMAGMVYMITAVVDKRKWNKPKELRNMSIMEVFSIFAPAGVMLPWILAWPMMLFALAYFYFANLALWGTKGYPAV